MAPAVTPEGKVLAVDVQPEMVAMLQSAVRQSGLRQIQPLLGAEDPDVPIKALHKMSEAQIKREAAVHPLVWDRTVRSLPWQHLVVFRKRT
jgi:hypothetical protein